MTSFPRNKLDLTLRIPKNPQSSDPTPPRLHLKIILKIRNTLLPLSNYISLVPILINTFNFPSFSIASSWSMTSCESELPKGTSSICQGLLNDSPDCHHAMFQTIGSPHILCVPIDYHEFLTFGGKWYARPLERTWARFDSISGFAAREREKERTNCAIPSLIDSSSNFFFPSPSSLTYLNARRARRWFPLFKFLGSPTERRMGEETRDRNRDLDIEWNSKISM